MQQAGPPHEPQQGQFVSPPGPQGGHMPAGGPMRIQPMQQSEFFFTFRWKYPKNFIKNQQKQRKIVKTELKNKKNFF